jgi:hypothetical protein
MERECASCAVRTGLYVLLQVASISQLTVSRLSRQCGILNISQPYRPPRPVMEITSLFFFTLSALKVNRCFGAGGSESSSCVAYFSAPKMAAIYSLQNHRREHHECCKRNRDQECTDPYVRLILCGISTFPRRQRDGVNAGMASRPACFCMSDHNPLFQGWSP